MLSTKGHYGSLSRQLTQSRVLEWESIGSWGGLAGRGDHGLGQQVEGTGIDIHQGL